MVLKVLLSVKCDLFGLHLPVLDINLVATQDNRDVLTDSAIDQTAANNQPDLSYCRWHTTKHLWAHLQRSLCHVGTFLYVSLEVTSNMMIAHCP